MNSADSTHASGSRPDPSDARGELFPLTQWSVISQARDGNESKAVEGLRHLAVNYWRPLYLYLRKRGESHDDASDSVQGFFEFVFSTGFLEHVEREGGKFRSYLLRSLERWRSRRQVREGAQKRGGHVIHVPMDGTEELDEAADLADAEVSPEIAFDRQWASEMVGRAVQRVRTGYEKRGRIEWFDALFAALPGGGELPAYTVLAESLATSEGAVKKAIFDLRAAFATGLREEIRATVRTNEDAEEELRYLVSVMGGR
jgi:DNA-directed RNA polymerase specialized sigma24 family protein